MEVGLWRVEIFETQFSQTSVESRFARRWRFKDEVHESSAIRVLVTREKIENSRADPRVGGSK